MPPAPELTEQQRRALETEARAKITWGHDPGQTVELLERRGMRHADARALVDALMAEASRESRLKGLLQVAGGVALSAFGAWAALFSAGRGWVRPSMLAFVILGLGLIGVGLARLISGTRDISDV